MSENSHVPGHSHVLPLRTYYIVFVALMLLLVATVVGAYLPLGNLHLLTAMTIAIAKAVLIVLYFMHLRYSNRLTAICAIASFIWLTILILFVMNDYLSRDWLWPSIEGK
jgi:cytochrome c oxidase subunit IV